MARTNAKRKKKRLRTNIAVGVLFIISCLAFLTSTLFLRTYNNSLSSHKQELEAKITELQIANDAVAVEVNTLNNRERVNSIAADKGLSLEQNNIITITKTDGD
ncbi:MAG: cell division protein FtsL [Solobacterium sp.]|nr:cell division protein FtsL [Solobacterium sp.]